MSKGYEQYCALMKSIGWPAMSEEEWLATHGAAPVQDVRDTPPEWDGTQRDGHEHARSRREPDHAKYDDNGNERAGREHAHATRRKRKLMSAKGDQATYGEPA